MVNRKNIFQFSAMVSQTEKNLLRHHITSTTCRLKKHGLLTANRLRRAAVSQVNSFQLQEWISPNWISLSQPSTHSDKTGRRATEAEALAAKKTLSKPSKCLSHYIGVEVVPRKHLLTSVSLLRESMSPAAKGALLIGMECLYGNS